MTKTKKTKQDITNQPTKIAGIAAECGSNCHLILPRSFLGKRVFACLKEELDKEQRKQERRDTETIGVFARSLISSGGKNARSRS
jgi:hypothetical protein